MKIYGSKRRFSHMQNSWSSHWRPVCQASFSLHETAYSSVHLPSWSISGSVKTFEELYARWHLPKDVKSRVCFVGISVAWPIRFGAVSWQTVQAVPANTETMESWGNKAQLSYYWTYLFIYSIHLSNQMHSGGELEPVHQFALPNLQAIIVWHAFSLKIYFNVP